MTSHGVLEMRMFALMQRLLHDCVDVNVDKYVLFKTALELNQLVSNVLLPDRQSAYTAHHSTETNLLRVLSDILLVLNSGDIAVLTLLDLSAAFDSVDHNCTLLQRLHISYGLGLGLVSVVFE